MNFADDVFPGRRREEARSSGGGGCHGVVLDGRHSVGLSSRHHVGDAGVRRICLKARISGEPKICRSGRGRNSRRCGRFSGGRRVRVRQRFRGILVGSHGVGGGEPELRFRWKLCAFGALFSLEVEDKGNRAG